MGQPGGQEVAGGLVVALTGDDLYRGHAAVFGVDQLFDDGVGVRDRVGEVGDAAGGLDLRSAAPRPRPGRRVPTMLARKMNVAARSAARGLAFAPHERSAFEVLAAGGARRTVVVDDLDLGKAAVVGDGALVLDEPRAEQRLAHGGVAKREVARAD